MDRGFPRLLGDIGGTNARWAWQATAGEPPQCIASYRCDEFGSISETIARYRADHDLPDPAQVAFGIATAVTEDTVRMTNRAWTFSIRALRESLGVTRCLVLNDFEALATALPALRPESVRQVGRGQAVPGPPMAVLGPGTGLGVAGLVWSGANRSVTIAGEGGHVTLAASTQREAAVLARLQRRFGHVSAERAVCGPGLVHLYEALGEIDARRVERLGPSEVTDRALHASDPACVEALAMFASFLGSVAGNLALTLGARGGVYLGGGIVPRLGTAFDALPFRERFVDKGRFRTYLEDIPTHVITDPAIGLLGAARALDALTD